jgi:hypothetical protein
MLIDQFLFKGIQSEAERRDAFERPPILTARALGCKDNSGQNRKTPVELRFSVVTPTRFP